jgi:hypothetical protein
MARRAVVRVTVERDQPRLAIGVESLALPRWLPRNRQSILRSAALELDVDLTHGGQKRARLPSRQRLEGPTTVAGRRVAIAVVHQ